MPTAKHTAILTRFYETAQATAGILQLLPDKKPLCFTLEDEYRVHKLPGETRIPTGTYDISLRTVGGFHTRYVKLFGDIHEGMLWLRNVPGFEYILIHVGNTDKDSSGCVLVGSSFNSETMAVGKSQIAYREVYPKLARCVKDGGLQITIRDGV